MKVVSHPPILVIALTLAAGLSFALMLPWLANAQGLTVAGAFNIEENESPEVAATYHVAKSGDGLDGLSWTKAFTDLHDALNIALSGDEIWVASGIYTPGIDVEDSFVLVNGVALYGGFTGAETTKSQRDWEANLTVLSGDIEGNDTNLNGVVRTTDHIVDDNVYHVITATGVAADTILDGFTVTAGKGFGDYPDTAGGGFFCDGNGAGNVCSLTLRNMVFSGNFGEDYAGAMFNDGGNDGTSSPSYTNVIFTGNWGYEGGAVYNYASQGGDSSPSFRDVIFISNSADEGGAIFNSGYKPSKADYYLVNVLFSGNWAEFDGGAISNEGNNSPVFANVTMSGNSAGGDGGGIYNLRATPLLYNSILWNNMDISGSGTISASIHNSLAAITITHSLVQGTSASGGGWILDPSYIDGGGNIDQDPLFVTPVNPATAPTNTGDLHLQGNSPAIDKGNDDFVTGVDTDLDGHLRISGARVDMGAYEYQIPYSYDGYLPFIYK